MQPIENRTMKNLFHTLLLTVGLALGVAYARGDELPPGWSFSRGGEQYRAGFDSAVRADGKPSIHVASIVKKPTAMGVFLQKLDASDYLGKRVRISRLVRSKAVVGIIEVAVRFDRAGESFRIAIAEETPLSGTMDWTKREVVVDVPADSTSMSVGLTFSGLGEVWISEVKIEAVPTSVPTTDTHSRMPTEPQNLDFEK